MGAVTVAAVVSAVIAVAGGCAAVVVSDHPSAVWLAVAGVLTAAALLLGSGRLVARRGRGLLLAGAVGALLVLCGEAALDDELRSDGPAGLAAWLVIAGSPAVLTGALALSPGVTVWCEGGRRG